ncbi:tRNA guanosine(15) transglycosylase TgtA [Methanocaldococcus indicus]|uniref:tRNA guanosine(15) transglycosylase TgtA n=1 Tax=Methanocaldococcus indicus TaxID=213231 RepID=UPI003C6D8919
MVNLDIKARDGLGKLANIEINKKKIETPTIMPVVHPNPKKQIVPIKIIKKLTNIVITNSYIIYKNEELKEIALKDGVHKLLDFDGVIVTDSGSYQLSVYGDIDVDNIEILKFQNDIGVDVGTILDIPTPPDVDKEKAEKDLEITLERAKIAAELKRKREINIFLNGTIQGSTYLDLRQKSAKEMAKLNFDIYPIGAVVPLMESYRFREVVEIILNSKMYLPTSKPIHLFGCGHPMFFSLAVLLGCDLFDSAAYALYAKDDRYLTERGTYHLEELKELDSFPCSCPICSTYSPKELSKLDKKDRERLLAEHNLYVTFDEINRIKLALRENSLWELVESRVRNHPKLLEAYRVIKNYMYFIEKFDPITKKSAFFYTSYESKFRPEVYKHKKRLKRLKFEKVFITNINKNVEKPYSENLNVKETDVDILIKHPIFGFVPYYIDTVYPLSQHECPNIIYKFEEDREFQEEFIKYLKSKIGEDNILDIYTYNYYINRFDYKKFNADSFRIRRMIQYQFDVDIDKEFKVIRSKNTGRMRQVYLDDKVVFSVRSYDNFLIPTKEGAKLLWEHLDFPKYRVVVDNSVAEFVKQGKNVFAKFVIDCYNDIYPYDEVLVVNEDDELLGFGTAILNSRELLEFNKGLAVKVRKGL